MKQLKIKNKYIDYHNNVKRIINICSIKGYSITPFIAQSAWNIHQEFMMINMNTLTDEQLFKIIRNYCDEETTY